MENPNWIAQLADTFFNGRRAPGMPDGKPEIHIKELIRRGTSHVRTSDGKTYKVVVTEVEIGK